ncbi:hypothetical protein AB0O00_36645, partial [Kitasatospora sp. NPDC093558]
ATPAPTPRRPTPRTTTSSRPASSTGSCRTARSPVTTPAGEVRSLLPPFGFAGVELPMGPVPALGAHTDTALRTLGYPADRIAELRASGVLGE